MAGEQRCDYCGGTTRFVAGLNALGREPSHQVFYCEACQRHTWTRGADSDSDDNASWRRSKPAQELNRA